MNNKAAKTFLFIALIFMALFTAAAPFCTIPFASVYSRIGASGIPLAAIYSIPALFALIAVGITSMAHRKWLYKGDKVIVITNIAVTVCILLLAGVRLFADFSFDVADAVRPTAQFIIIVSSALLLGFTTGMFISSVQAIAKERRSTPPAERKPITYPQMFTVCWALLCTLFIGFGFIFINVGSPLYPHDLMCNLLYFGVLFLVLAAGISGLACLAVQLWSRSKWLSVLIGVMTFVVALVLFITYIHLNDYQRYLHDYYYGYDYDDYDDYDETYAVEAYDDSWQNEYGSVDSVDELMGPDTAGGVSDAIRYAVKHVKTTHMGDNPPLPFMPWMEDYDNYWDGQRPRGTGSHEYWKLANYIFRRSCSTALMELFDDYKGFITMLLPYEKYRDNGYERTVDLLITSYDDMGGSHSKFASLYRIMSDENLPYLEKESSILSYISQKGRDAYYYDYTDGRALDNTLAIWGYSFWARRYHECDGNPEDIYNVLTAIQSMYGGPRAVAVEEVIVLTEPDEIE